ncbi:PLP-dependent decarboxylase [Halobacteriovorax sp. JY17]|uniref:PLP-dependent decarboxylase n=1 Tax=Halobacteriovorax sp. JY17 TaxID=2014617 RepID=UPI000C409646|nr:PLP-dependent decarboxylase [Halobacteriovorax sp. JY17]PIK15725.1 MAG: diaminopimelate decarboxylase [Halobacteriovorax sp. JY17]
MKLKSEHKEQLKRVIKRLDSSFYFYDLDGLKNHLTYMRENRGDSLKLWYACKANPMSAILKIFRNLDFGLDVASQGELEQVLSAGILPDDILSTGPSKSRKYLRSMIRNEVDVVVLESLNQAYWLDEIAKELGARPKVLLRAQLDWDEGKSVLGGDEITPFGLDSKEWLKLDKTRCTHLDFQGFHVFQWGNILDLSKLESIWTKTIISLQELSKNLEIEMKVIDLGGGLGIPYADGEVEIDFKDVNILLEKLKVEYNLQTIWMELGRFCTGPYGHYLSQVIDRKTVRGKELLVLDGGINHIARPALTNQTFPCEMFRDSDAKKSEFTVHGPLCTALDKLGTFDLPSDINEGDWLVFSQAGAYGFTEAMPFFLCHNLPAEVILYNGDLMTPRTIKSSSDWLI